MKSKSTNATILEVCSGIIQDIWNKNQPPSFRKTPRTLQKTAFLASFCPKICFFSTLRQYNPLFWPQRHLTQWDHIFPMSSGNSGYLWFSGRCPFGRSAGRFLAPIAQNGPFWPENLFFSTLRPYNPLFWPQTDLTQLGSYLPHILR